MLAAGDGRSHKICGAIVQAIGGVNVPCTSVFLGGGPAGKLVLGDIFMRSYFTYATIAASQQSFRLMLLPCSIHVVLRPLMLPRSKESPAVYLF